MLKAGTEALKNFNKMLNKDKQDDDNDEEN